MPSILLVDEDQDLLGKIKQVLTREEPSFQVSMAHSTPEALEMISEEPFDLVIAAYQLPSMDGLELLELLRSKGNKTPFIMSQGERLSQISSGLSCMPAWRTTSRKRTAKIQLRQLCNVEQK